VYLKDSTFCQKFYAQILYYLEEIWMIGEMHFKELWHFRPGREFAGYLKEAHPCTSQNTIAQAKKVK
jgi:hypothetical protein